MTEKKLQKYLKRKLPPIIGHQTLSPIILTDSKAKYLIDYCTSEIELQIKWRFRGGRNSSQGFNWLQQNLDKEIGHLDNIHLYVWLGTCDLTVYDGKYVTLSTDLTERVKTFTDNLHKIIDLLKPYPACRVTFFEIPPYSIIDFNKSRHHTDPNSFKKQEEELLANITDLNNYIRQLNESLNTFSPNFTADISHPHNKKTSKSKKTTLRDNYQFSLYKDGIHPDTDLAKVWLKKIAIHVQKDCWG